MSATGVSIFQPAIDALAEEIAGLERRADGLRHAIALLMRGEPAGAEAPMRSPPPKALPPPAKKPPRKPRAKAPSDGRSPVPAKGERRSEELRARVRALWATDATPAAIGSELGVSATRVYQIKKELNLPDRGRPARPERTPVIREPAARTPLRLTVTQGKLLAILQRAAPHPVGHEFIRTKLFGGVARERGEELLTAALGGLKAACDDAGVVLRDIKGFGISVEVPA